MNNIDKFLTQVLLHGFKGFKNMEYWEIEFFLNQHKWATLDQKNKELITKKNINLKQENEQDEN